MRQTCCQPFVYPCYYGNAEQSFTTECEYYWLDGESQTVTIPKNTIYSPTCSPDADAIALELATYEAQALSGCDECCMYAVCVDLLYPSDVQYLEYFTASQGVLFSRDVTIVITPINRCPNSPFGFTTIFLSQTLPFSGGATFGGEIKLLAGVIYEFGVGTNANSMSQPERYSLGWDCNSTCAPDIPGSDSANQFPFGIAQCPLIV